MRSAARSSPARYSSGAFRSGRRVLISSRRARTPPSADKTSLNPLSRAASALRRPTANSGSCVRALHEGLFLAAFAAFALVTMTPLHTKIGGNWLGAHERRHQHLMSACPKRRGSPLAVNSWARDDNAHIICPCPSIEISWPGTMLELASSFGPDRGGVLTVASSCDIECRASVRSHDQSAELHCACQYGRVACDRSFA